MDKKKEINRAKIGKLSGMIGIGINLILAISKIIVGSLVNSMSVVADGLNNLSDMGSSIVTLIGFKLAEKPADKEHPYGHARSEYLAGLIISIIILFIGGELLQTSFFKILNPKGTNFSVLSICFLIGSILVKIGLMEFNMKMGKKIESKTLIATAEDSRNDVLATMVVLLAGFVEYVWKLRIDGYAGFVLALFILYSGYSMAKDTISPILGEGADTKLRKEVFDYILSYDKVLGCHDFMVHDYGPHKRYASIHVEIDYNMDVIEGHELIDNIEKGIKKKFELEMLVHHDPVVTDDEERKEVKCLVETLLKIRDRRISLHDFRLKKKEEESEISFDMVLPADIYQEGTDIAERLAEGVENISGKKYKLEITFDTELY